MDKNQITCSTDQTFCALIASPLFIMIINSVIEPVEGFKGLFGNDITVLQSSMVSKPSLLSLLKFQYYYQPVLVTFFTRGPLAVKEHKGTVVNKCYVLLLLMFTF